MLDGVAVANPLQEPIQLVAPGRWLQQYDRLADDLTGGVAVDSFGGRVPRLHDAIERLAENGVLGRLHDGGEVTAGSFGLAPLDELTDALGDLVDQAALLGEKRPFIGRRVRAEIRNRDHANLAPLHDDGATLLPGGLDEVGRGVRLAVDQQPRTAILGVLPAGREQGNDLVKVVFGRAPGLVGQVGFAIEGGEFLDALAQAGDDAGRVGAIEELRLQFDDAVAQQFHFCDEGVR